MRKILRVLWKIIKWLLIVLAILAALVFVIAKVPAVQKYIIGHGVEYFNNKTGGELTVQDISLNLPFHAGLEGVSLKSPEGVEIAYVGELDVHIGWRYVLKKTLRIDGLTLKDVRAQVLVDPSGRANYDFVTEGFSGTTAAPTTVDAASKSPWDISIGRVELSDINALYADAATGDSIHLALGYLSVNMDRFSLNDNAYRADAIWLKDTEGFIRLSSAATDTSTGPVTSPDASEQSTPLDLGVNKILLENNRFVYAEAGTQNRYFADLGMLELNVNDMDLDAMKYDARRLALDDAHVEITMEASAPDTSSAPVDPFVPMNVALGEVALSGITFRMETVGRPEETLVFAVPELEATDLGVDPDGYALNVRSLKGSYGEFDRLKSLEVGLKFTRTAAEVRDLSLRYGNSRVDMNADFSYADFAGLIDRQAIDRADISIAEIYVPPPDVAHFRDVLHIPDSVLALPINPVRLEALLKGDAQSWKVDNLVFETGETRLSAKLEARGGDWADKTYRVDRLALDLDRRDVLPYTATAGPDTAMIPPRTHLRMTGMYGPGGTDFKGNLETSYGNVALSGHGTPSDTAEFPMAVNLKSRGFQFGKLLALGESLHADFDLSVDVFDLRDTTNLRANVSLRTDTLIYGRNKISNIGLKGHYEGDTATASLSVRDTFAVADLNLGAHIGEKLSAEVTGTVKGMDFQGLEFTRDDLRGQFHLLAQYSQEDKTQKGYVLVDDILFIRGPERFDLTPVEGRFLFGPDSSVIWMKTPFADLYSVSNRSVEDISLAIVNMVGSTRETAIDSAAYWNVDFKSKDAQTLQDLFLPALKTFEPATAKIRFDVGKNRFDAELNFPKIEYSTFKVDSLNLFAEVDSNTVNGNLYIKRAAMDTLALEQVSLKTANTKDGTHITFEVGAESDERHYHIEADLKSDKGFEDGFAIQIADTIMLNGERWDVDPDNNFKRSADGMELNKVLIHREGRSIEFNKKQGELSTEMTAENFPLSALSGILQTKQEILTGDLFGKLDLNYNGSFAGSGKIENLKLSQADFGTLTWEANKAETTYHVNIHADGEAVAFGISGDIEPESEESSSLDLMFELNRLSLESLHSSAPSLIQSGDGKITGEIGIKGSTVAPQIKGQLAFENAHIQLAGNEAVYRFGDEKIEIEPDRIAFNNFTIRDSAGQRLVIDGNITHKNFGNVRADLSVKSHDFELIDLKPGANELLYGNLVADLDIQVTGRADAPDVTADIGISPKTNLAFVVPESDYEDSFDESLVEWTDFDARPDTSDILTRDKEKSKKATDIFANTVRLTGSLHIDPQAEFKVIVDSMAGDYLMIRGSGDLGITYDRLGNLKLNGSYEVADGFYQLTFYNLVKRKFRFQKGSRLTWNGAPTNADLSITAIYETHASVAGLMVSGGSASESSTFTAKLPFEVLMKITGELMEPEIAFDIVLADEAKGALGGSVEAKLAQLRQNEGEMNKQVFALLVLNGFIGESGGGDNFLAGQARNSASRILSQQLNRLSDQLISGVDINFDLQSYGGAAGEGMTDLSVDIAKSFADDRVIVRVGSTFALEESTAAGQQSQEMMTNVVVEYKITADGRYRFKVFRENNLEDIVVGRITRTGAGFLFQRDFDRFNVLFRKAEPETDPLEEGNQKSPEENGDAPENDQNDQGQ